MCAEKTEKSCLTVYYRVGCHLCEQMAASLRLLQRELDFSFELVDIDQDEQLRERYNADVPVVVLNGEVICFHFFEEESLRQHLE